MNPQIPILGGLYVSLAGHDKGRTYVVTKIIDSEFVMVCDGKYRNFVNPKRKRLKHLKALHGLAESTLLQKIMNNTAKDNEIHKQIQKFKENSNVND